MRIVALDRRPGRAAARLGLVAAAAVVLLALPLPWISADGSRAPGTAANPAPTFVLAGASPSTHLAGSFWGADARIYYPANATLANAYVAGGLSYVRWPGGAVADQYNLSSNRITQSGGHFDIPPTSPSQFAQWCAGVHCQAIVQLPAEIDSPSTAAYEVAYLERTVGFHPAYFELGDEPALWKHFGIPWGQWNASQHVSPTPAQYANLVHAFIPAIRAVDPTARILGLPGVGTGGYDDAVWIHATVAENGPNLSGVAIHVYPAGPGSAGTSSISQFYRSLGGSGSLGARIPMDRAALRSACPSCANSIPIFVTELGSGTGGAGFDALMKSYADVPYIATELIQGISQNVSNLDLFALEGTYPGSLVGPNSATTAVGTFYDQFAAHLGSGVMSIVPGAMIPGFHLIVTTGRLPGSLVLFAVNTNLTSPQLLSLAGSGFPQSTGQVMTWNDSAARPSAATYPGGIPSGYIVPPEGILMVVAAAPFGMAP